MLESKQILKTGWWSWTPWWADTQIQFNDGGAFWWSANFLWNKIDSLILGDWNNDTINIKWLDAPEWSQWTTISMSSWGCSGWYWWGWGLNFYWWSAQWGWWWFNLSGWNASNTWYWWWFNLSGWSGWIWWSINLKPWQWNSFVNWVADIYCDFWWIWYSIWDILEIYRLWVGSTCYWIVTDVDEISWEIYDWYIITIWEDYSIWVWIASSTLWSWSGATFEITELISWSNGLLTIENPTTSFKVELNTSLLSANRVATFQDWDGTLAFLSDITGGLQLPTYTVGAVWTDYPWFTDTAIQSALDAGNWKIFLTDGTYVLSTGLKFKSNYQYIEWNGEKCIIQFDGATVPTAISPNTTNLKQGGIKWVSIQQTNATVQGTALDLSDMAIMDVDVEIKDAGVAVKMNDANNNTFYNRVNIKAFGCIRGIELNWANPSNHNYFSWRIANKSGGDYGIYIVKGQWNSFKDISLEPAATTWNTGIYLTSASAYANTFENMWIEGNNVWVTIDSTVTYNTFIGGTITANSTNLTDNWKQTAFYNTQVASVQKTNINPWTVIDNGNASDIAWNIKNNTSFAHVWWALVETELRNGSDTSILNRWKHAWTWKFVSALNGATELFSVDSSGSSSTMLSQVQNIITKDTTLNWWFSAYIPSYMEVANWITLTVSNTSYLQVW